MSRFVKMRVGALAWGFLVSWAFTGKLVTAIGMFAVLAIGNTLIMWHYSK